MLGQLRLLCKLFVKNNNFRFCLTVSDRPFTTAMSGNKLHRPSVPLSARSIHSHSRLTRVSQSTLLTDLPDLADLAATF